MNTDNICINGAEIQEVMWKIGSNPWASNFIQPFTQGDQSTAVLKVFLDDCAGFEGKMLEAFVQVPNDAKDIVKIFALIDANNQALFTLPTELLWWPGDYNVQFMFADGDKVNYSNVLNAAYTVNENPALSGQNPPTILPGDKAEYEDLISKLSAENTKAEQQIPILEEKIKEAGDILEDTVGIDVQVTDNDLLKYERTTKTIKKADSLYTYKKSYDVNVPDNTETNINTIVVGNAPSGIYELKTTNTWSSGEANREVELRYDTLIPDITKELITKTSGQVNEIDDFTAVTSFNHIGGAISITLTLNHTGTGAENVTVRRSEMILERKFGYIAQS